MNRLRTAHPTGDDLLRFADGEASAREAKRIQSHLAACWKCRTGFAELQTTICDCVRYRQSVLPAVLPEPPAPWFDIYRQFDQVDASEQRRPRLSRFWASVRSVTVQPRRWAPALALLVIGVLVVDQFRNAPSVRAAELLQKAAVAHQSRAGGPRRIQITTGKRKLTRVVGGLATAGFSPQDSAALAELQPLFQKANYSWDDPLSAASFASWRDGLAEKRDEVSTIGEAGASLANRYRIRTTTNSSELIEATLELTVRDLRPVESKLHFRGQEVVELAELANTAPNVSRSTAPATALTPSLATAKPHLSSDVLRPATPGEELKVFAVLHRLGADLGEPVEITRNGGQVVVTGVGVSPQVGEQIHEQLTGMPRVSVQLSDPVPVSDQTPNRPLQSVSLRPEIARLQTRLENHFGGRAELEQFTDEVLGASDELMARIHALRRLADRFPPEVESQLAAEEGQLLSKLRREHAVAVAGLAVAIEERTKPAFLAFGAAVPQSLPAPASSSTWQAATGDLLRDARAAESLLAAMLGGASTGVPPDELPAQVLLSISRLRARAADYVRNSLD